MSSLTASSRVTLLSLLMLFGAASVGQAADPTYWQDVRPIMRKYCTACHSARHLKELDVSGGLALDTYEATLKGGKRPVIHVGKSSTSPFVTLLLTNDTEKRMPLASQPVPPESIDVLRRWIDSGAREGQKPNDDTTAVAVKTVRTRKLDVTLPTAAVPPRGLLGSLTPARLEMSLSVGPLAPVTALAFSPDGKILATGSYGRVTLWELDRVQPSRVLTSVLGAVHDLKFSPDGKILAVAGGQPSAKGDLRLFSAVDGKPLASLGGHQDVVACVAFDPQGGRLLSASFDKTVRLWDVPSHKTLWTFTGHSDFVYSVAFSPDGQWLATASKDRTVKVVDAVKGQSRLTMSGMNEDVLAVSISADGANVISSGYEPALFWWNSQTGERLRTQGGHGTAVHEIAFSKEGKTLATAGGDRTVRLWPGAGGAAQRTLSVGSLVYTVALSPDGKRVASGSFDGLVRLWDVATGRPLVTLLSLPTEEGMGDWLALTPEGYVVGSPTLATTARWRMSGQVVTATPVWRALGKDDAVRRAARGESVTPPVFEK